MLSHLDLFCFKVWKLHKWLFGIFHRFFLLPPPSLLLIRLQLHTETKRSILNHSFKGFFLLLIFSYLNRVVCCRVRYHGKAKLYTEKKKNKRKTHNRQNDWSKRTLAYFRTLFAGLGGLRMDLRRRNVVLDLFNFLFACILFFFFFCKTIISCVWDFLLPYNSEEYFTLRYFSTEKKYK